MIANLQNSIFGEMFHNSFDSTWVVNLKKSQLEYANKTTETILGHSLQKFFDDSNFWLSIVHPDDKSLALNSNQECFEKGTSTARYRMIHLDGHSVWLLVRLKLIKDDDGKPFRLIGSSMDVTEATLNEQKLKDSGELFQSLAIFAPIGIYKTDLMGKCNYVNKVWMEISGQADNEAFGDGWSKAIHPDDVEKVFKEWNSAIENNKNFHSEFRFLNLKEGVRYVSSRAAPILSADGATVGFVGSVEDITDRINAEATLNLQRQKLVSSAKMSSLGEMASGIAHEINNPLTIIAGTCSRLKRELGNSPAVRDVDKIESTVFRISKIIKGLKSFSRNGEKDILEMTSIGLLINETLDLCRQRFKNHEIQLNVNFNNLEEVDIEVRPTQILQVLLNLLGNAFDAVEAFSERWVDISVQQINSCIRIMVTDSGTGIPADIADKIMNPFFTTKDVGKGTGLGLSISKGIMEENGGKLYYDSTAKNTRFVIEFPFRKPN
jgi:PAS domain S-box-containing protein